MNEHFETIRKTNVFFEDNYNELMEAFEALTGPIDTQEAKTHLDRFRTLLNWASERAAEERAAARV